MCELWARWSKRSGPRSVSSAALTRGWVLLFFYGLIPCNTISLFRAGHTGDHENGRQLHGPLVHHRTRWQQHQAHHGRHPHPHPLPRFEPLQSHGEVQPGVAVRQSGGRGAGPGPRPALHPAAHLLRDARDGTQQAAARPRDTLHQDDRDQVQCAGE